MIVLRRMLAVFLLTIAMPHMTMAEERIDESTELVNRLVTHIQGLVNSNPDAMTIRAETDAVIHQYFDYDLIARFAAGNAWRSASDDQRSRYKTVFREVMLSLAETQFDYFKTLEYKGKAVIPKGRKLVIVSGTIHDRSGSSISRAVISRNVLASCQAVNATVFIWRGCSNPAATCCCLMSRERLAQCE